MKKLLLVLAMFAVVSTASAQSYKSFRMGPKIGMNVSGVTGDDASEAKYKTGFAVGLAAEYSFSNWFALSGDLMFSQQGYRGEKILGMVPKFNANYINIPIMANFYVIDKLALKVGVQPGFNVMARGKMKSKDDIVITNMKEDVSVFDLSIPVGISYDFMNSFRVEARYAYGVTNLWNSKSGNGKNGNSVFTITVGWML